MEVGAVKQAFNNEIILLKKNLNQAKIQIIHKLTRRAKTLVVKEVPESLKEKLKRKAESAVKEVLIIKKINTRDLARFIVTHSGKLNDFINKPIVDNDKACARLLLHKALQEKYKHIREKFSDISIKDLFMSRQERRKLKKEARENQKNKKKGKDKKGKADETVNVEGEWDVEIADDKNTTLDGGNMMPDDVSENGESFDGNNELDDENVSTDDENDNSDDEIEDDAGEKEIDDGSEVEQSSSENNDCKGRVENSVMGTPLVYNKNNNDIESSGEESNDMVTTKSKIELSIKDIKSKNLYSIKGIKQNIDSNDFGTNKSKTEPTSPLKNVCSNKAVNKEDDLLIKVKNRKLDKKGNSNKNKNLKNKLEKRNFNKETDDAPNKVTKMVDPFFITSTGDNYMSLVEPREPDEVKEVHKQGNRQYRRAVMFGHVPKRKPQRNFEPRHINFNKNNNSEIDSSNYNKKNLNQNHRNIDDKKGFNRQFDRGNPKDVPVVPEKLHPSWEAKKKQSGILPFQGKKIVFDES
ncbi:suppressor of Mek1 [Pararge aegeria]|uniref:suppressor of Mek1 n=1 Tax=Pararge aegeria TaxID=116150 RepID=UPI0019D24A39|nr:suppressor of Mek1 [Pararge aegeria]